MLAACTTVLVAQFLIGSAKGECQQLADPSNGYVVYTDDNGSQVAMYFCDKGFDLSGNSRRRCDHNQQWTGSQPTCDPVNCGEPGTPENGFHNGGTYTFGAQVTYNCTDGYVLLGNQTLMCLDTGEWSDLAPACDPVNCGDPGMVENAQRTGDAFTYQSVVTYTCKPGFHAISGTPTIQCMNSGKWKPNNFLVCAPAEGGMCGDPGTVDNAIRTGDVFTVGSVVEYTCTTGYEISGSSALLCTSSNNWNDTLPACDKLISHSKMPTPQANIMTSQTPSPADSSSSAVLTSVLVTLLLLILVALTVATAATSVFVWFRRRKKKVLSLNPSICDPFLTERNPCAPDSTDNHNNYEMCAESTAVNDYDVHEQPYTYPNSNTYYAFDRRENVIYQQPQPHITGTYAFQLSTSDCTPYQVPVSKADRLYNQLDHLGVRKIPLLSLQIVSYIGSGQFGNVKRAIWTKSDHEKLEVAVKTLKKHAVTDERIRFLQEAVIMGQFNHPNVVKLHGVIIEDEAAMLISEIMSKGDLHHYLVHLRGSNQVQTSLSQLLLSFCQQVCAGMSYLAGKAYIHRDLAARNILIAEDLTCKVVDFGMSRDLADDDYYYMSQQRAMLPVKWTPPEVFNYKKYSTASDVWSFGCLMYEIWSLGHKPFENFSNLEAVKAVSKGFRLGPPPGCSREIYKTMINCWDPTSSQRPSFHKVMLILNKSRQLLLEIPEEALSTHPQAGELGASLKAGQNMYPELQSTYL